MEERNDLISATGPGELRTRKALRLWQPTIATLPCVIALAAGLLALRASPEAAIGPYGLIQAISPLYYLALGVLVVSFAWSLGRGQYQAPVLGLHLIVAVFLLHGAPGVIESEPRFATAWLHAGFTDYIAEHGALLTAVDARFSWPAFFTGLAMLSRTAGLSTTVSLIRWWPVALNILYLPLIFSIASEFLRSRSAAWIATAIFPLANWVGQDYYSPQSLAFLLYLAFIFILIGPLGCVERPPGAQNRRVLVFAMGALILLMAAMASGHQLTPIVAAGSALVLALTGRTRIRWLVLLFILMAAAWICYGAVGFWSGHFGMLMGGFGSVQSNIGSSFLARVHGSVAHRFVVDARLGLSLFVWLASLAGAVCWRSGGRQRIALIAGFAVPFGMLAGGSYGGEVVLRVYLFTLPYAVCLAACLISRLRQPYRQLAVAAALFLLVPFFLVTRWGNELFELVRPNEVTAVKELYRIAPPGSSLVSITPQLAWQFTDVSKYKYEPSNLDEFAFENTPAVINLVNGNPLGGYVIITTGQIIYGWQAYGLPPDWGKQVDARFLQSPYFQLRYANPDAEIFQYLPDGGAHGQ